MGHRRENDVGLGGVLPMVDTIDLDEVARITERRNAINAMDLSRVHFVRKGEPIVVSPERRDEWRFTGMNIIDFAITLIDT